MKWPLHWGCLVLAVAGCQDPAQANNPQFNTQIGRATGIFEPYRPRDYLCEITQIGDPHLILTLYKDVEHPDLGLTFDIVPRLNERFQGVGYFQFKLSEPRTVPAFLTVEWGKPIDDVRPTPVKSKFFPVMLHHARVPATAQVCDTLSPDCIVLPESELFDSTFWCEDLRPKP